MAGGATTFAEEVVEHALDLGTRPLPGEVGEVAHLAILDTVGLGELLGTGGAS